MDPNLLKRVVAQVHKRYPEFAGCQPKVRLQTTPQGRAASEPPNYLLTFKGMVTTNSAAGAKTMPRYLRIVVNAQGKILKETTSR